MPDLESEQSKLPTNQLQEENSMDSQHIHYSKINKFFTGFVASLLYFTALIFLITGAMWGYEAFIDVLIIGIFSGGAILVCVIPVMGGIAFMTLPNEDYAKMHKNLWKKIFKFCLLSFAVMSISELLHYVGWLDSYFQLNWGH